MLKTIILMMAAMLWAGMVSADDKIDAARKRNQVIASVLPVERGEDCGDGAAFFDTGNLVECTRGALVYIVAKSARNSQSGGSGFFIDLKEGYVITNHHVIANRKSDLRLGEADLRLRLANGEEYRADIVGSSPEVDIAVLKIANLDFDRDGLKELVFAGKVRLGETVIALGAPFGLQESVTKGIVSGINRTNKHLIQTDAAINGGNSGGPLLNNSGKVVGVNRSKLVGYATDNVGFAIPAHIAKTVSERIIEQGYFRYGYLGIYLQELHTDMRESFKIPQDVDGVLITRFVEEEHPKNLKVGDAIVAVNDTPVSTPAEVISAVKFLNPGTMIDITLYRDGKEITVQVAVKEYRKMNIPTVIGATGGIWGITFEEHLSSADNKLKYLLVKQNRNLRTDLAPGDKVIGADNIGITDFNWFKSYLKGREKVVLHVQRGDHKFYVVMNK